MASAFLHRALRGTTQREKKIVRQGGKQGHKIVSLKNSLMSYWGFLSPFSPNVVQTLCTTVLVTVNPAVCPKSAADRRVPL